MTEDKYALWRRATINGNGKIGLTHLERDLLADYDALKVKLKVAEKALERCFEASADQFFLSKNNELINPCLIAGEALSKIRDKK